MLAVHFQQPTDFARGRFPLVAMPCVLEQGVVTAISGPVVKLRAIGLGKSGGAVIDDTARGLRTVFHLTGTFEKFDARHASCLRRIIRIRRGIGRGRRQDPILHHRHLGAAIAIHTTQRNVRKVSKSILIAHIHTRNTRRNLRDVGVTPLAKILGRRVSRRSRKLKHRLPTANHRQRLQGLGGILGTTKLRNGNRQRAGNGCGRKRKTDFHGGMNYCY